MVEPQVTIEALYSLVYWFLCLCFVIPPQELVHAGVTVQNIFSRALGDEKLDFIRYHIRRASLTLFIHSLLPLGYVLLLIVTNPAKFLYGAPELALLVKVGYMVAAAYPIAAAVCVLVWSRNNWSYHPLTQKLKNLVPGCTSHTSEHVSAEINSELRRPDLFASGLYSQKVHVTDNWIIKVGTYNMDIVHQTNCVLSLHGSEEYTLTETSPHGVQYLQIDVRPVDKSQRHFVIRLKSEDYAELRTKLQAPLVNARNVVIKQSVTERFVEAFTETANRNIKYIFNSTEAGFELDSCMGCTQTTANVKLVKLCAPGDEGECRQCYCRPMWCMDCLAKWFCHRQDQTDSSNWLSGKAGCPMCRATFCMYDVCSLQLVH